MLTAMRIAMFGKTNNRKVVFQLVSITVNDGAEKILAESSSEKNLKDLKEVYESLAEINLIKNGVTFFVKPVFA